MSTFVVAASIGSGASLSAAVNLGGVHIRRIQLPAAWTAAPLTFQSSEDGVTFNDLYDSSGEFSLSTAATGTSRVVSIPTALPVLNYVKVRSGSSASAVNQAAARTVNLICEPE